MALGLIWVFFSALGRHSLIVRDPRLDVSQHVLRRRYNPLLPLGYLLHFTWKADEPFLIGNNSLQRLAKCQRGCQGT
ncbi:uncharacterized protein EI90DRAFT_3042320 [Cantharellus anzutake]|uniref:uncharacterized protein n=1 Tax=Cantharellus anzutake TaxID=1750568 RepID=UPI0019037595|nr:uncharacterized protein EI90DRAFT_3042320 [Cantharellus anzutake]KAF8338264.1 hypothetical protein EI90DRAFT_3042320 [Cantharellus anzutake]